MTIKQMREKWCDASLLSEKDPDAEQRARRVIHLILFGATNKKRIEEALRVYMMNGPKHIYQEALDDLKRTKRRL